MLKGLLMMSGMGICMLVYGPRRYKQLKLSWRFQLLVSGLFAMSIACSMIGLMESVIASIAIFSVFVIGCVIWAIVVRKKYPIEKEVIQEEKTDISRKNQDRGSIESMTTYEPSVGKQVKKCEKCGADNDTGALYCSSCGKKLKVKTKTDTEKSNKHLVIYLLLSIVLVLVIVIACLLINILNSDGNTTDATNFATDITNSTTDTEFKEDYEEITGIDGILEKYKSKGETIYEITWDELMEEPGIYEDKTICFEAYLSSIGDYAGYSLTNKKENISYDSEYDFEIINQCDFKQSPYIQGVAPYLKDEDVFVSQGDRVWVLGCLFSYDRAKTVSGEFLDEYRGTFAVYEIIKIEE